MDVFDILLTGFIFTIDSRLVFVILLKLENTFSILFPIPMD